MPRYFFHLVSATQTLTDNTGVELVGPTAAHWYAVKLAYRLRYQFDESDFDWVIKVGDEGGETTEVFIPPFRWR